MNVVHIRKTWEEEEKHFFFMFNVDVDEVFDTFLSLFPPFLDN